MIADLLSLTPPVNGNLKYSEVHLDTLRRTALMDTNLADKLCRCSGTPQGSGISSTWMRMGACALFLSTSLVRSPSWRCARTNLSVCVCNCLSCHGEVLYTTTCTNLHDSIFRSWLGEEYQPTSWVQSLGPATPVAQISQLTIICGDSFAAACVSAIVQCPDNVDTL
jgi:hypothetical protein